MKHFLLVLLGFSAVSVMTACKSDQTSEMRESDTVKLDITGMT